MVAQFFINERLWLNASLQIEINVANAMDISIFIL